jgi:energy-coupling factor transporter transmembrane protein EcfT
VKFKLKHTGKAIVYSLLVSQAVVQLILFIFFRHEEEGTRIGYIFISFFFSFVGLLFGILLCIISNTKEHEGKLYFAGQIIAFGLLLYLYIDRNSPEKVRARKFENASDSYQYIYMDPDTLNLNLKPTQLAIVKLESQFNKRNSFLLNSYSIVYGDTLISGKPVKKYTFYVFYDIPEQDSLFSKIIVVNDSTYIEKFNADPRIDEDIYLFNLIQESNKN